MSGFRDQLERVPEGEAVVRDPSAYARVSTAISLKRIADNLDALVQDMGAPHHSGGFIGRVLDGVEAIRDNVRGEDPPAVALRSSAEKRYRDALISARAAFQSYVGLHEAKAEAPGISPAEKVDRLAKAGHNFAKVEEIDRALDNVRPHEGGTSGATADCKHGPNFECDNCVPF